MTIIFLICIIIKEKWVFTVQFITQAGCSFLEIKGMKFSRGKPEPLSKLMTSVMRIAETIGFFLSRALNECKPKAQHEFSANHTCALNESELKAKHEFSAAGRVEILNECKPKAQQKEENMLTSLALIFLVGLSMAAICQKIRLPRIIGMLFTGILLGPYVLNWLDPSILSISSELRSISVTRWEQA